MRRQNHASPALCDTRPLCDPPRPRTSYRPEGLLNLVGFGLVVVALEVNQLEPAPDDPGRLQRADHAAGSGWERHQHRLRLHRGGHPKRQSLRIAFHFIFRCSGS